MIQKLLKPARQLALLVGAVALGVVVSVLILGVEPSSKSLASFENWQSEQEHDADQASQEARSAFQTSGVAS